MATTSPNFAHLLAMSDEYGTFEHADHAVARREHGYCADDVARVLVVAVREPDASIELRQLARTSLRFLLDAQGVTGRMRNRRTAEGSWHGRRTVEDCWGRGLWAVGTAAAGTTGTFSQDALAGFERGAEQRSPFPRSMAFAALGAAAVLRADEHHLRARALLVDALTVIGRRGPDPDWPWPQRRLTYANAVLPDALIAAGTVLGRSGAVDQGLDLLGWLLDRETVDGHLSVTPTAGAGPSDPAHGFDQQPIEVATMADACARAHELTGDERWATGIRMAAAWFDGDNDSNTVLWDPATGGGFDGLEAGGANQNQGAESTLALLSTQQQARRLASVTA